jgi:hypothetical protein
MVTMHPLSSSNSSRRGMTVTCLDFASVAICPNITRLACGPSADQMQRREPRGMIVPAMQRLTVVGHDLARQHLANRGHPGPKAVFERPRRQQREHPPEGVVGGDGVGQFQKLPKPCLLGAPERRHTHPIAHTADHRRDRDHHPIDPLVAAPGWITRVLTGWKNSPSGNPPCSRLPTRPLRKTILVSLL